MTGERAQFCEKAADDSGNGDKLKRILTMRLLPPLRAHLLHGKCKENAASQP